MPRNKPSSGGVGSCGDKNKFH